MYKHTLSYTDTLEDFILNKEFYQLAGISQNAYKFWKNSSYAQYPNSRIIFLEKSKIADKHKAIIQKCSNLDGLMLASAFCSMSNLSPSHLNPTNNSKLLKIIKIVTICDIKFVDYQAFCEQLNIPKHSTIYIEKCCYFAPAPYEKKIKLSESLCLGYY